MKESARYTKTVEWSETDQCFIGSCPDLFYGGCHGDDEKAVFAELCDIVEEVIELYNKMESLCRLRRPGKRSSQEVKVAGARLTVPAGLTEPPMV
jgi:predicted RNase H-like HicB family nuclease